MSSGPTRRSVIRTGLLGTVIGAGGCLRLSSQGSTPTEPSTAGEVTATSGNPTTGSGGSNAQTATDETVAGDSTKPKPPETPLTDWPLFRTDPAGTGYHPEAAGPTDDVEEVFRVKSPQSVTTSPILADGLVYYTDDADTLKAVDASTGEVAWTQTVPEPAHTGSVAVADGRLYVGNQRGTVYAIDAANGSFLWNWSTDVKGFWGSPIVANGSLYVADVRGGLHALDPGDGTHRWVYQTDGQWVVSTPAVDPADGTVYVSTMTPLEIPDGHDEFFFDYTGSPGQVFQWFGMNEFDRFGALEADGSVEAVDGGTGDGMWSTTLPDFVVSSPAVVDGRVFVGCWDANLYGLNAPDGTQQWTHETAGPICGSPTVFDGQVFITSGRGNLYNIDARTGDRNWFLPIDGPVTSAPSITPNAVYVSTNYSGLLAVDIDAGRSLWQHRIGDSVTHAAASPVVSGNRLYITGNLRNGDEDEPPGILFALEEPG